MKPFHIVLSRSRFARISLITVAAMLAVGVCIVEAKKNVRPRGVSIAGAGKDVDNSSLLSLSPGPSLDLNSDSGSQFYRNLIESIKTARGNLRFSMYKGCW